MSKAKFAIRSAISFCRRVFSNFGANLTWRGLAIIAFVCLSVFSLCVVALELLPSRLLVKTTFVATLETQNLSVRVGQANAVISGVSGTRISLRDLDADTSDYLGDSTDLTQLPKRKDEVTDHERIFLKASSTSYLELDSFVIPAGRAMELSSSGDDRFLSLRLVEEDSDTLASATVVWKGQIATGTNSNLVSQQIGSERWSAVTPLVEIEAPHIDGLTYNPMEVVGISTDRLRLHGSTQIATSALLSGVIQFYFGSYPSEPVSLGPGEFTRFSGLNAQLSNLALTENGVRFVLVGEADSTRVGFLGNLRDIQPSLLDGLLSIKSLVIILSSIFALVLAVLSAVSLGKPDQLEE